MAAFLCALTWCNKIHNRWLSLLQEVTVGETEDKGSKCDILLWKTKIYTFGVLFIMKMSYNDMTAFHKKKKNTK